MTPVAVNSKVLNLIHKTFYFNLKYNVILKVLEILKYWKFSFFLLNMKLKYFWSFALSVIFFANEKDKCCTKIINFVADNFNFRPIIFKEKGVQDN